MFATYDFFFLFFLGFVLTLIITIAAFLLIRSCKFCWQKSNCDASGNCSKAPAAFTHQMPFIIYVPPPHYGKGLTNSETQPSQQRPIGSGYYTGPPTLAGGAQSLQVPSFIDPSMQEYLPGGFYMTLIEDECYGGPPGSCQAFKIVPADPSHEGPHLGTCDDSHDCMTHSSSSDYIETPETLSTSDSFGISFGADDMANFV